MADKLSTSELIAKVAEATGVSKKVAKQVIDTTFDTIGTTVADGGSVTVQGFARFFTKEAAPRDFKKIGTDEVVSVGARTLPKAKFSKNLVESTK